MAELKIIHWKVWKMIDDGLTNEFYEIFWNQIKETYINSITEAKLQNKVCPKGKQSLN